MVRISIRSEALFSAFAGFAFLSIFLLVIDYG
jgi:hypothetical protein